MFMSNFRANILEAVQTWRCLAFHLLRFLQADHHSSHAHLAHSIASWISQILRVSPWRILSLRVMPMMHLKVFISVRCSCCRHLWCLFWLLFQWHKTLQVSRKFFLLLLLCLLIGPCPVFYPMSVFFWCSCPTFAPTSRWPGGVWFSIFCDFCKPLDRPSCLHDLLCSSRSSVLILQWKSVSSRLLALVYDRRSRGEIRLPCIEVRENAASQLKREREKERDQLHDQTVAPHRGRVRTRTKLRARSYWNLNRPLSIFFPIFSFYSALYATAARLRSLRSVELIHCQKEDRNRKKKIVPFSAHTHARARACLCICMPMCVSFESQIDIRTMKRPRDIKLPRDHAAASLCFYNYEETFDM